MGLGCGDQATPFGGFFFLILWELKSVTEDTHAISFGILSTEKYPAGDFKLSLSYFETTAKLTPSCLLAHSSAEYEEKTGRRGMTKIR